MSGAWLLGLVATSLVAQVASPPTFPVDVETVQVDVLVARGGKPVAGLTAADFLVLDSGVVQQVELAAAGDAPVNAVLVLDTSASLAGERIERLRSAAAAFVGGLREGDRVALVTFSRQVRVLSGLSPERVTVPALLERAVPGGMTALNDGLYAGLSLAEGTAGRCALVLFTDGADNISWLSEAEVVETARDSSAVVYVVASSLELSEQERALFTRDPREAFLKKLASVTGGRLLEVRDDALLKETFESALAELRARYVLRYTPQGVPEDGWHSLEVRLRGKKGDVKTRPGYVKSAGAR